MLHKIGFVALGLLLTLTSVTAQNISNGTFGKGIKIIAKDSSFSMKFSVRFQTLMVAQTQFVDNLQLDDVSTNMLIRRSRLKFNGFVFSPKWEYKMEFGLSNRDIGGAIPQTNNANRIILDAVVKWHFAKNTSLWFGQTKLPGNRERVISSQQLQFVDRSLLNSRFNIDRDAGVQLRHHFTAGNMVIREIGSISSGEGRNITTTNTGGYDYTARVEFLPMGKFAGKGDYSASDLKREEKPKLAIGITYDFNDGASRQRGQLGSYFDGPTPQRDLESFMADFMFKWNGFSMMGEFVDKQTDTGSPIVLGDTGQVIGSFFTGQGLNLQAGYLFKNNLEVSGRYTSIMPNSKTGRNDQTQYTLGVSRYIVGHALKVQSDFSYLEEENVDDPTLMFRLQVEVAF